MFLLAGAANLATGGSALFIKLSAFLVATIPVLVALGLVRAVALLRRGTGASWRDALGAFFIWQSTSVVVARASVLGLFARKAAFLRTPKTSEQAKWHEALRANWAETTLALLGIAGIAGALTRYDELAGPLLAALLFFPTIGLAAAPLNSWAAQRAALPPDLVQRRTSEWKRADRRGLGRSAATVGGLVTVLGVVVAAMALLLAPSPRHVQSPPLVAPDQTHASSPAPTHSRSSPATTPPSTPPSTPASTRRRARRRARRPRRRRRLRARRPRPRRVRPRPPPRARPRERRRTGPSRRWPRKCQPAPACAMTCASCSRSRSEVT